MSKFHDFDPLDALIQCQRLSQTSFNNTQELARAHNEHDKLLHELLQQHNNIVDLLMKARREIELLKHDIAVLRRQNSQEKPQ